MEILLILTRKKIVLAFDIGEEFSNLHSRKNFPSLCIILFEKNLLYSKNATPFNIYVRRCSRRNSRLRDGIILFKITSLDKF